MTSTGTCQYCKGDVPADAAKCRHCGEWLTDERPREAREPLVSGKGMGEAAIKLIAIVFLAAVVISILSEL